MINSCHHYLIRPAGNALQQLGRIHPVIPQVVAIAGVCFCALYGVRAVKGLAQFSYSKIILPVVSRIHSIELAWHWAKFRNPAKRDRQNDPEKLLTLLERQFKSEGQDLFHKYSFSEFLNFYSELLQLPGDAFLFYEIKLLSFFLNNQKNLVIEDIDALALHLIKRNQPHHYWTLIKTLKLCSPEVFLKFYKSVDDRPFTLAQADIDPIMDRLFSLEDWGPTPIPRVLQAIRLYRPGPLTPTQMAPILKWIREVRLENHIIVLFSELANFADAPYFLTQIPCREDLKFHLLWFLFQFSSHYDASLTSEQQTFYAPRIPEVSPLSFKCFSAAYFPNCKQLMPSLHEFDLSTIDRASTLFKPLNLCLNDPSNITLLQARMPNFIRYVNGYIIWPEYNNQRFVVTILQTLLKVVSGCQPTEGNNWIQSTEMRQMLTRLLYAIYDPNNSLQNALIATTYPSAFLLLAELVHHAPEIFYRLDFSVDNLAKLAPPNLDPSTKQNILESFRAAINGNRKLP